MKKKREPGSVVLLSIRCVALLYVLFFTQQYVTAQNLTQYVNPFIGTANSGNTYPNALAPHGMISVGAQNDDYVSKPSYHAVSYTWGGNKFYGVSHTNLSGVGCPDMGSLLLFPQSDSISLGQLSNGVPLSNEKATPGFYGCTINNDIQFQATVSTRSAIETITFSKQENYLLVNLGRSLSKVKGAALRIINNKEIAGHKMEGRFCGRSPERKLYFVLQLTTPAATIQLFEDGKVKPSIYKSLAGTNIGAAIHLGTEKKITVKVGISYVSEANARQNLMKEIGTAGFEQVQNRVTNQWEQLLQRIKLTGGADNDKVKFYTALYHVLLHPNIINDVNGEYPLMGNRQGTGVVKAGNRFTVFSLWDTYRNVHPLLTLVYPHLQQQMVQTMINMYKESGQLPKWEVGSGESYTMVGDPAAIVIADTYIKGITNFDVATAYKALLQHASVSDNVNHIRPGYRSYLKYGFIPEDDKGGDYVWGSVSTSLEYYLADWCVAQLAKKLGDKKNETIFLNRSAGYKNYFDNRHLLFRPKLKDDSWYSNFEPTDNWKELGWKPSGGIGFVEGSSWEYTWFVPHDINGLKQLFGGDSLFTLKLQTCFDSGYFKLSNEPDMGYPWLFNYVEGAAWRTKKTVADCINKNFGTGPDGLPGNDDCGTLSAWLLFAMMGFYPDCPGSTSYQTAVPVFDKIEITLDKNYYSRYKIVIEKKSDAMWVNGSKAGVVIDHKKITAQN